MNKEGRCKKNKNLLALIDGDFLLYKVGFGSQKSLYKLYENQYESDGHLRVFRSKKELDSFIDGEEEWSWEKVIKPDSWGITKYNLEVCINTIMKAGFASTSIIFFTDVENFRDEVATILPYKGNRDFSHKPYWFKEIKEYLLANYDCRVVYKCEADDALGIYQCTVEAPHSTVIYTPDKDLDMIPGYRLDKNNKFLDIDEDSARRSFYSQLLTGDATDNIPGLYKVTGQRVLKRIKEGLSECEVGEEYKYIFNTYNMSDEVNVGKEILKEIATLLYMKRDYDDKVTEEDFVKGTSLI